MKFHAAPGYIVALNKEKNNPLVEVIAAEPGPEKNRSVPEAPQRSGKEQPPIVTAGPPDDGKTLTSLSLQVGRASRRKTRKLSVGGVSPPGSAKDPAAS